MAAPEIDPRALADMQLFRGLEGTVLAAIAARARVRQLPKDLRIFSQGDQGAHAHAVIDGGVRIVQTGADGAEVVMRFIGPGEMFGTVALFTDGRYPADAITLSDTLEASWTEAELLQLMARYPQIAINVIRILGGRLQEAQHRVRELATQRAERRVAHAVLRLAQQAGHSTVDGTAIEFPLRRKDVADISGTTLHTASRILTAWEKAGLLLSNNQRLIIRQPAELRRIAEDAVDWSEPRM
ncbi:MAG: Crp/Fnr family transcriptional regulator [Proteobacteria bacterium]|nr:Crp/Fnr family transcriptional regulator [Pseudomonadota bacterium]